MKKDTTGITKAMHEMNAVSKAYDEFNYVPALTAAECSAFAKATGFPAFTLHSTERGLLAGVHNSRSVKRGTGVEIAHAVERLYDFRRSVREALAKQA